MNPHISTPAPDSRAEGAAVAYIADQLPKARKALKRSRILGAALVLVVGVYFGVITVITTNLFQPRAAAEVTSGMLSEHIAKQGPTLVAQAEKEIPILLRQLPDYLIEEVPRYREQIEHSLETELSAHCAILEREMGNQMDALIDAHKPEMKALMENANDRAALRKIVPDLERLVNNFLDGTSDGAGARQHINDLAAELQEIDHHVQRLADNKNLAPEEQKARRSLAILARAIKSKLEAPSSTTTTPPVKKLVRK
jgi:hypothetical protein